MDAILFIHHNGLSHPVTRKHFILFKHLNPDCEVISLSFPTHSPETYHTQKQQHDVLMLNWFVETNPKHERFILAEWDSFSTCSLKEFFGDSWNKKVAGSQIVRPWSDEPLETTYDGCSIAQRDWDWFRGNKSPELHPYLRGIVPASIVLFSHDALWNMCEIWKANRAAYDRLQCEVRLGTLACHAGYEPSEIRPGCNRFVSCRDVDPDQRGVMHRVRC